jgi:hypothetical protein
MKNRNHIGPSEEDRKWAAEHGQNAQFALPSHRTIKRVLNGTKQARATAAFFAVTEARRAK